ncbi:MAG: 30S ribosomal protein S16 [Patescibacteria group bacterium]|nr:30S ribosomal protein S16 [Patescibacteria group bacterium]
MLIIRLQRVGKRKFPTYRLIVSEKNKDTQGTYLEALGTYNPHAKENQLLAKIERVKYWLSQGAQMSATINNLLVANKIVEGKKEKSVFLSKKRKTKLEEKNKAKVEADAKAKVDAAAKAEAEVAAKVQAEADAKATAEAKASPPVGGEAAKAVEPAPAEVAPVSEAPVEVKTEEPAPTETPAA